MLWEEILSGSWETGQTRTNRYLQCTIVVLAAASLVAFLALRGNADSDSAAAAETSPATHDARTETAPEAAPGEDVTEEEREPPGDNEGGPHGDAAGTDKQFGIGIGAISGSLTLTVGAPYTPTGGEMSRGDGQPKESLPIQWILSHDSVEHRIKAYNIDGSNYYHIRDMASALNITLTLDGGIIKLET